MSDDQFPYAVNEQGEVTGRLLTYGAPDGVRQTMFVPDPAGPVEGWQPGQEERFRKLLDKQAAMAVKRAMRLVHGTANYWLISEESSTQPLGEVADRQAGFMARSATS